VRLNSALSSSHSGIRSTDRDEILREHADCGCKLCDKLKFANLRNSIWRMAAILVIENSLYISNCSSDHDEILQEYADWGRKQWGRLKFAYLKNSRWRAAAILEIDNSHYFHHRSTDEFLHEHADCCCKQCEK